MDDENSYTNPASGRVKGGSGSEDTTYWIPHDFVGSGSNTRKMLISLPVFSTISYHDSLIANFVLTLVDIIMSTTRNPY
jgi:hypothetical protein